MPKLSKTKPTVGLEIEFLIPWKLDDGLQQPTTEAGLVRVPIGDGILSTQTSAARIEIFEGICKSLIAAGNKAAIYGAPDSADLPSWNENWVVKRDSSVHEDNLGDYNGFVDVEINSPIYNAPPDDDKEANKWKRVTKTMLKIQEDWPSIHINNSCAYQVHVGLPTMYSLLDVKRLATILWLAETRLLGLYSPHRRQESGWYKPLSKQSRLALGQAIEKTDNNSNEQHNQDQFNWNNHVEGNYHTGESINDFETWISRGLVGDRTLESCTIGTPNVNIDTSSSTNTQNKPKLEAKLVDLWKAETVPQVCYMLGPKMSPGTGSRLAYNFNNVSGIKGTVEFRQMEATLDPVHLQNWATVCYKLVLFARDCNVHKFRQMILCLLNDTEQYSTWELLKDLKCQANIVDWFTKKNAESG